MLFILTFLLEFAVLFFLSRELSRAISHLLLRITKKQTVTIYLLSILFMPGVIVHELSHMLMAGMLMVPVGHMEFIPQIHGNSVKLGSVAIAKTDPLRRFLIGVAPILIGLTVIFSIYFFLFANTLVIFSWQTLLFLWVLFEVGNTMFSSRKDMEGAIGFLVIASLFIFALFFFGVHVSSSVFAFLFSSKILHVMEIMDVFLLILICIDSLIISLIKVNMRQTFLR